MSRRRRHFTPYEISCVIDDLATDGRGVARVNDKVCFIHGALPTEEVRARVVRSLRQYDEGETVEIISASPNRVVPKCAVFGTCGGCALQHLNAQAQIELKLQMLLDNFKKLSALAPAQVPAPITGPVWNYRYKARLAVKQVTTKGRVLVGFMEKTSRYVTDMRRCEVLAEPLASSLVALSDLIGQLSQPDKVPQIEVAVTQSTTALVFRHLYALTEQDIELFKQFELTSGFSVYLQAKGLDSVVPLSGSTKFLHYQLSDFDLDMAFEPTDFTQINPVINEKMVSTAISWLDLGPHDTVLDLFCGIGNFTLAAARRSSFVVGVEGSAGLVEKAQLNSKSNNITNAEFYVANLAAPSISALWMSRGFNKIILDPPRLGALDILNQLDFSRVTHVLYVSCHPASLARDAAVLVNEKGFILRQATVLDMFPHTAHVESMALFEK